MTPDILVIDDDAAILMTIADILRDEGYTVRTAASGLDGLAAIQAHLPVLILLDMRMPGLDGWGVARALRDRDITVPMIAMTAAQDMRWGEEIGAARTLAKPFDLIELLKVVEQIVEI
jgi:two-component system response regulator MprA